MNADARLVAAHAFFRKGEANAEGWSMLIARGRGWESAYRDRWRHDKVVRSTHGVNCTGSCSWNVYVKDGLITWESQAVDYPRTDPDRPNHEPRGCPRGASFSWYTYSPVRLKFPYVRGSLLELWRAARATAPDPVAAFAQVAADGRYRGERGRGGMVRCDWVEASELVAAATVHAIREHGPDRVGGFTPIPAMSPVSFAAGTRFLSLIGGHTTTFYDWYADLPPASPQVFGDQTDVPESADWWDASYLIVWGTNLPITRTPDAHFMTEARYRGQKVVVVSPDYSDHVKFADDWLPAQPGTDGALAMAMGHVMLKEFWVDRPVARFEDYGKRFTDLPLLVALEERDGLHVPGRFLMAADIGDASEHADWKPVVLDAVTGAPAVPNGSVGFRYGEQGKGHWNLGLGALDPVLSVHGRHEEGVEVALPRFDIGVGPGGAVMRRGVPAIRVGGRLVTTVLDLMLATYGVARDGLPGEWPEGYDDATQPYTPAWQEALTSVDRHLAVKVAREFGRNAEVSGGRSMICMGAGTNHWFHSDETYRSFIALLLLGGCVGINGGGWAHYVGQEKIRTFVGWQTLAFALDWRRPPRQAQGTSWFYGAPWMIVGNAAPAWVRLQGLCTADQPLEVAGRLRVVSSLRSGWPSRAPRDASRVRRGPSPRCETSPGCRLRSEVPEPPHSPSVRQFPVETVAQARGCRRAETRRIPWSSCRSHPPWHRDLGPRTRPRERDLHLRSPSESRFYQHTEQWRYDRLRPERFASPLGAGLFGGMTAIDAHAKAVRMGWMPSFPTFDRNPLELADEADAAGVDPSEHVVSELKAGRLNFAVDDPSAPSSFPRVFFVWRSNLLGSSGKGQEYFLRHLLGAVHDGPLAEPLPDWRAGECEPVPGRTMPNLTVVERDYGAVAEEWAALGPLAEQLGANVKSASWIPDREVRWLAARNGRVVGGAADSRPSLERAEQAAEAMLALSGVSNGRLALAGFRSLEERCGVPLASLAEGVEESRITFQWMLELGEGLPAYRPPVDHRLMLAGAQPFDADGVPEVTLRYLTPHSKWSIHSEYQDNLHMLTLFRGGSGLWMSPQDAEAIDVRDNDWVEAHNRNGIVVTRVVVSHRVPQGVCLMYHSKDRQIGTPRSVIDGRRGGTENALTTIAMKPTHMIGGYAQLSWAPNYYGPTGSNRDSITIVRKRRREVEY